MVMWRIEKYCRPGVGRASLLRKSVRQEQGRDRMIEEGRVEHEIVRVK